MTLRLLLVLSFLHVPSLARLGGNSREGNLRNKFIWSKKFDSLFAFAYNGVSKMCSLLHSSILYLLTFNSRSKWLPPTF